VTAGNLQAWSDDDDDSYTGGHGVVTVGNLQAWSDDDDDSYTGGHGVVTAGNLQAWRDGACSRLDRKTPEKDPKRIAVDWCVRRGPAMMMIVTLVVLAS